MNKYCEIMNASLWKVKIRKVIEMNTKLRIPQGQPVCKQSVSKAGFRIRVLGKNPDPRALYHELFLNSIKLII